MFISGIERRFMRVTDCGRAVNDGGKRVRSAGIVLGVYLLAAALAGCASSVGNTPTFLADPGLYEFHSCEQILAFQRLQEERRQQLRENMEKAERSAAGAVIGVMAYRVDYAAAGEELKVLAATARAKNCPQPQPWRSTTAIR